MIPRFFAYLATTDSILHRMDPRMKLACTMTLLLVISAVDSLSALLYPGLFLLAQIPLSGTSKERLLAHLVIILPFMSLLGILFLFSFWMQTGSLSVSLFLSHPLGVTFSLILVKSSLALLLIRLLIQTTSLNDLLWAMRRFRIPRIITTLSKLVSAYLHILHDETERIIRARNSRTLHRKRHSLQNLAHISASVFLRSFDRADRLYKSMLARGFNGEYPDLENRTFHIADFLALLASLSVATVTLWKP